MENLQTGALLQFRLEDPGREVCIYVHKHMLVLMLINFGVLLPPSRSIIGALLRAESDHNMTLSSCCSIRAVSKRYKESAKALYSLMSLSRWFWVASMI